MHSRDYLIGLAIKYLGQWADIYRAISAKEEPDENEISGYLKLIKCKTITILDDDYPDYLKGYYHPPFVLFYYGDISLIKDLNNVIGVVGSREPDPSIVSDAYQVIYDLAKEYIIISGLAKGIDGLSHKAAIEAGGKTIAVLPNGIEFCYPAENESLYEEIKRNHLVISEYPFRCPPERENFHQRNRLIAYLSRALFVPSANLKSGTSITVNYAVGYHHNVYCFPSNNIHDSLCNFLIKQWADLVTEAGDIIQFEKK